MQLMPLFPMAKVLEHKFMGFFIPPLPHMPFLIAFLDDAQEF